MTSAKYHSSAKIAFIVKRKKPHFLFVWETVFDDARQDNNFMSVDFSLLAR